MAIEDAQDEDTSADAGGLRPAGKALDAAVTGSVQQILSSVRAHLDMDVAFVSEFAGPVRYFRHVDAKAVAPLKVGDALAMTEGYCQGVVTGALPQLIVDTASVPAAMAIPETLSLPIGSHLSVPIRLKNGDVYGTFCCFNFIADQSLNPRDLHFMQAFAEIAAFQIDHELEIAAAREKRTARIVAALDDGHPAIVYQPVVSLSEMRVVGVECLSRFGLVPKRGPDRWFAEAREIGYGTALELQAIRNALAGLARAGLPDDTSIWLNASASTLLDERMPDCLDGVRADRIVLELTEHDHVDDYAALVRALQPLRARGVRIAIDDAGAGYSSMSHILNIGPDHIKLDLALTRNIDNDRKRRALAAALIEFGRQTDCSIVAEGVESISELHALRRLGVQMAQGYFLAMPADEASIVAEIAAFDARDDIGQPRRRR